MFHDITLGNNIVDALPGRAPPHLHEYFDRLQRGSRIRSGLGAGFDRRKQHGAGLASGQHQLKSSPTLTLTSSLSTLTPGGSAMLTATVTASNGGKPTGTVTFSTGATALGTVSVSGGSQAHGVNAFSLVPGSNSISAVYSGAANYNARPATTLITVTVPNSPAITGVTNAASYRQVYAPGMIMAVFGSNLGPATPIQAPGVPLPTSLGGAVSRAAIHSRRSRIPNELLKKYDAIALTGGAEAARDLPNVRPRTPRHSLRDGFPAAAESPRLQRAVGLTPEFAGGKHVVVIGGGDTG